MRLSAHNTSPCRRPAPCVSCLYRTLLQGSEDHLKVFRYFLVFQRDYVEELGELRWRLADFSPAGDEDQLF